MNQSELKANTCSERLERKKGEEQVTIDLMID